ncbi:MAG: hypothetical protein DRO67_09215 [Candidatus Asgardarchaeum californiense]|nr:MAG: hypothetical protein DRO67_09215 [Candidatus Asgardarchaeum californiense]
MSLVKCSWNNNNAYLERQGLRYLCQSYDRVRNSDGNIVNREVWYDIGNFGNVINSRQGDELTKEETDFFLQLPKYYRDEIAAWSPINNKKSKR